MIYKYRLEKYTPGGRNRYQCPSCGQKKQLTRYVDRDSGKYLDETVGKCNREANCGYHYPPRDFFANNPQLRTDWSVQRPRRVARTTVQRRRSPGFDTVALAIVISTLRSM